MSIDVAWLKLETYVALTSNTFQLGASIEAGLELGPIGAHGWFRFDAIVQYSPFYFTAAVDAGFDIEVLGESLYGVRVSGTLSGPGPFVLHARASVKILFVRISGDVTVRLGSSSGDQVPAITNVLAPLQAELRKPANLRCEGEDPNVILQPPREVAIGGPPVLGAVGTLIWEQKRVPFGIDLQRFEGAPLDRVHHITLTTDAEATPETDWFGLGSYLTLSESEALNNARFTQAQSGTRVSLSKMIDGIAKPCDVSLDLVKLPKRIKFPTNIFAVNYMTTALNSVHEERSGSARVKPGEPRVTTKQESWNAHDPSGAVIAQDVSSAQAFAAARGKGLAQPATTTPINLQGVF